MKSFQKAKGSAKMHLMYERSIALLVALFVIHLDYQQRPLVSCLATNSSTNKPQAYIGVINGKPASTSTTSTTTSTTTTTTTTKSPTKLENNNNYTKLEQIELFSSPANGTQRIVSNLRVANENKPAKASGKLGSGKVRRQLAVNSSELSQGASILRPSFLRNLIGGAQKDEQQAASEGQSMGGQPGEGHEEAQEGEEEEVTQTIMVPMSAQEMRARSRGPQTGSGEQEQVESPTASEPKELDEYQQQAHFRSSLPLQGQRARLFAQTGSGQQAHLSASGLGLQLEPQPKAEASLQLTNYEMSSILNDKEAPEFYKERESGAAATDGLTLGEERPSRLSSAASSRVGPQLGSGGVAGGPFGAASYEAAFHAGAGGFGHGGATPAAFGPGAEFGAGFGGSGFDREQQHRLAQAASEFAGHSGSFMNRFGSQFGTEGESGGRLMQSPNEYSEMSALAGSSGGYGPSDFSPQSGMLFAGSGSGSAGDGGLSPHMGSFNVDSGASFGSSGYAGMPALERHASELYPGAFGGGAGGGGAFHRPAGFHSHHGGRLYSAASHGGYGPASELGDHEEGVSAFGGRGFGGGGPTDAFAGSFGNGLGGGLANAASQQLLMRGTHSSGDLSSHAYPTVSGRLAPLSASLPIGDEPASDPSSSASSKANMREFAPSELTQRSPRTQQHEVGVASGPHQSHFLQQQHLSQSQQHQQQHQQQEQPQIHEPFDEDVDPSSIADRSGASSGDAGPAPSGSSSSSADEPEAEGSSVGQSAGSFDESGRGGAQAGASLALNAPAAPHSGARVEFSRSGSAGYLPPNILDSLGNSRPTRQRILKKMNGVLQASSPSAEYDPAENPAHAGKYIID